LNGAPIVVERSSYVSGPDAQPRGGDAAAAVTAPATSWFVQGATDRQALLLALANPGDEPALVTAVYTRADGVRVAKSHVVAAGSRFTVNVAAEDPALARAVVSARIDSTNGTPVVVERSQWWGEGGAWDEGLSGAGATGGGSRWIGAEGELGGDRQATTALTIVNPGATATDVVVTLLFENGPEASATFTVGAEGQLAVPFEQAFPTAAGQRFSVLIEAADPAAKLLVDRAIFWSVRGSTRTAGADAPAAPLP
jgi:hypothetical protein